MNLDYITDTVCNSCGAKVVAETRGVLDESGTPYETRTFECGHMQSYSPQISRYPVATVKCPNDPEELGRLSLREKAKASVTEFVTGLDVDDMWKNSILNRIHHS